MTYAFPLLCAAIFYLAARELGWLSIAVVIVVGAPVAWILADFVSGLVHWFADTYGADDTPLFGPWLIKPFRQHHQYARDICTHNLVLTIGNSCTVAAPFQVGVLYLLLSDEDVSFTKAAFSFVFNLFAMAMVATNVLHKWAHAEKTNWADFAATAFKSVPESSASPPSSHTTVRFELLHHERLAESVARTHSVFP